MFVLGGLSFTHAKELRQHPNPRKRHCSCDLLQRMQFSGAAFGGVESFFHFCAFYAFGLLLGRVIVVMWPSFR